MKLASLGITLAATVLSAGSLAAHVAGGSGNNELNARARAYVASLNPGPMEAALPDLDATPSFARQTGLACSVCHTHYPELTPTGRAFKLNGYVLRRADSLQGTSAGGEQNLLLNLVTPLSFMVQTSFTQTSADQPGTQNGTIFLPDQLSLFTGGEISPHMGAFLQLTFDPQSGQVGIDNADFRYANSTTVLGQHTVFGLSLNNNPTVQDLWNSTPAWSFPYASSAAAPTPAAAALIDGGLGGQVAGLSAYTMLGQHLYAELGGYGSAPVGVQRPVLVDSLAGRIKGVAPYWRVAFPFNLGDNYVSFGTYGMVSNVYPANVGGDPNTFTDIAGDVSLLAPMGGNSFTIDGTLIHESQHRPVTDVQNTDNSLTTVRLAAMYHLDHQWAFTLAPFSTTGTADNILYPTSAFTGSATNTPDSQGLISEVDVMPWQNVRLQLQYVAYTKFNGGSTNYDGAGRNASDNNTLYALLWLLF